MDAPKGKLNYECVSRGEPEVRGADRELKCASHPWRQSGSLPVPPRLRGPWREDPQVVMVTNSRSMK